MLPLSNYMSISKDTLEREVFRSDLKDLKKNKNKGFGYQDLVKFYRH